MGYDKKRVMTKILCFYHSLLGVPCSSIFVCENYSDCQALLKFKSAIASDPDGHLQAWNEANPFCNWTGVTCHEHFANRVVALELANMRLQGSLSPFLFNLSLLTNLSLPGNAFHGEIPASFGGLSELVHLNLTENKLQGIILSSLRGCQRLKFMYLEASLGGDSAGSVERLEQCCIKVFNVALMCTEWKPQDRPSMSYVVQMLSNASKEVRFEAPNGKKKIASSSESRNIGQEKETKYWLD